MKKIQFFLAFIITVVLIIALNTKIGDIPALGKLLNPTTGFWQNAETDAFYIPDEIRVDKLNKPVEIYFDDRQIPHIFAEEEHDLYFAQGFVVASLRLWQMEFQVYAADGRLSEIIGDKTIEFDKNQRRLGLGFGARNKLRALEDDPIAKDLISAYTEGVNAYIDQLKTKDLPIEYKLLGYKPEEWTNYKTMLVLMNMSNILASMGDDIENTNFVAQYGKELFDIIYPSFINIDPVIPKPETGWHHNLQDSSILKRVHFKPFFESGSIQDKLSKVKEQKRYHIGSNNWAISGKKTESGYPILCNDPHLKFSLPSVWLEMHLSGPQSNAYGVTFPGSPGIIIGFNDNIAWGMTNSGRDVKDFYTLEYKDATKELYHYQNQWLKSDFRIEEIKVRDDKTVLDTVIYTKLGPVCYTDFETSAGNKDIAVQWMAHKASKEYMMFYKLNRAKNFDDYLEATKYFDCPAQNMVFASVNNDIALRNQGKFPINAFEQSKFLQTSNDGKKWDQFIPFEENPMQYNPKRGFVSSANQESTDSTYPYYYTGWFENYRNRVINSELGKMKNATIEDMKKLQTNNFNLKAAESLPTMLSYINILNLDFEAQNIYNALDVWDFYNNKESKAAIYYELFFDKYYQLLWDELGDGFVAPSEAQTIYLLTDSIDHILIDNKQTTIIETQKTLLNNAFAFVVKEAQKYEDKNWGQYNDVSFQHVARIDAFSRKIEYGGNNHIVNATRKQWGASWRMIVDFDGGKIKAVGVYPGGQSGNPGSKHYDDMLNNWLSGTYHDLINEDDKSFFENNTNYKQITISPIK